MQNFAPAFSTSSLTLYLRQSRAWNIGANGGIANVNAFGISISQDQGPRANYAPFPYLYVIPQRGVDAYKTRLPDFYTAGNHNVRGKETVIMDCRVMANMVAAPKCDVVSNEDKGLNGIVFQDEAIVPYPEVVRTVACELI